MKTVRIHLAWETCKPMVRGKAHRRNQLVRLGLLCVSSRFQRELGQLSIRSALHNWNESGRLHPGEYDRLKNLCESQELDEYARCFGMHLSVKLSSPFLIPLKVGGFAAFATTGSLLYLLPMAVSPILRTAITGLRLLKNGRRGTAYGEALLVGTLPVVGNLAFPVQMYASHPELSTFLIRDTVARLSRWFPVYGGKDSRLEIGAIKAADIPLELIDIGVGGMSRIRNSIPLSAVAEEEEGDLVSRRLSRWDRLVDQQLAMLRTAAPDPNLDADATTPNIQEESLRRAA